MTITCKCCGAEIELCDRCWSVCTGKYVVASIGWKAYTCCWDCADEVRELNQKWWKENGGSSMGGMQH